MGPGPICTEKLGLTVKNVKNAWSSSKTNKIPVPPDRTLCCHWNMDVYLMKLLADHLTLGATEHHIRASFTYSLSKKPFFHWYRAVALSADPELNVGLLYCMFGFVSVCKWSAISMPKMDTYNYVLPTFLRLLPTHASHCRKPAYERNHPGPTSMKESDLFQHLWITERWTRKSNQGFYDQAAKTFHCSTVFPLLSFTAFTVWNKNTPTPPDPGPPHCKIWTLQTERNGSPARQTPPPE